MVDSRKGQKEKLLYQLDPADKTDPQNIFLSQTRERVKSESTQYGKKYKTQKINKSKLVTPRTLQRELHASSIDQDTITQTQELAQVTDIAKSVISNSAQKAAREARANKRSNKRRHVEC